MQGYKDIPRSCQIITCYMQNVQPRCTCYIKPCTLTREHVGKPAGWIQPYRLLSTLRFDFFFLAQDGLWPAMCSKTVQSTITPWCFIPNTCCYSAFRCTHQSFKVTGLKIVTWSGILIGRCVLAGSGTQVHYTQLFLQTGSSYMDCTEKTYTII